MDEDIEIVDWGNEEEDGQGMYETYRNHRGELRRPGQDEEEDAVSLGGDDDDMQVVYAYQSRSNTEVSKHAEILSSHHVQKRDTKQEHPGNSTKPSSHPRHSPRSSVQTSQPLSKLIHALPAKPVVAPGPFPVPQSQLLEASAMAQSLGRPDRERRHSSNGKKSSLGDDPLPADWEARQSRSGGREVYYYNVKTCESTWTRPVFDTGKTTPSDRSRRESEHRPQEHLQRDRSPLSDRPGPRPRSGQPGSDGMSFEDRHYRPGVDDQTSPSININSREDRSIMKRVDSSRSLTPEFDRTSRTQPYSAGEDQYPGSQSNRTRTHKMSPHGRRPHSVNERRRDSSRNAEPNTPHLPAPDRSWDRHEMSMNEEQNVPHNAERSSTSRLRSSPSRPSRKDMVDSYIPPTSAGSFRRPRSRHLSPSPEDSFTDHNNRSHSPLPSIPRRRRRDLSVELMHVDENEPKRRRADKKEDPTYRIDVRSDIVSFDRGVSPTSLVQLESTRPKRVPLPPQSIHFRTANPSNRAAGPSSFTRSPHSALSSRDSIKDAPRDSHGSRNVTAHASIPEQAPPLPPPGRRSRFADQRPVSVLQQSEGMDVDPASRDRVPRSAEATIRRSGMYADREEIVRDLPPKGPRAMAAKSSSVSLTSPVASPLTTGPSQRLSPSFRTKIQRSPQPHLKPDEAYDQKGAEQLTSFSMEKGQSNTAQAQGHESLSSRNATNTGPNSERWPKRSHGRPPAGPLPKLSGTNNVPISNRKGFPVPLGFDQLPPRPSQAVGIDSVSSSSHTPVNRSIRTAREFPAAVPDSSESTAFRRRLSLSHQDGSVGRNPTTTSMRWSSTEEPSSMPHGRPRMSDHDTHDTTGGLPRLSSLIDNSLPAPSTKSSVRDRSFHRRSRESSPNSSLEPGRFRHVADHDRRANGRFHDSGNSEEFASGRAKVFEGRPVPQHGFRCDDTQLSAPQSTRTMGNESRRHSRDYPESYGDRPARRDRRNPTDSFRRRSFDDSSHHDRQIELPPTDLSQALPPRPRQVSDEDLAASQDYFKPRSPNTNNDNYEGHASLSGRRNGRPLLDRLSLDEGDDSASFRGRDGEPSRRNSDEVMEDGESTVITEKEYDDDRDRVGPKGGRNKKRIGKPRRVRKNLYATYGQ